MRIAALAACLATVLAAQAFAADRVEAEGATSAFYMLKPHIAALRDASGVELVVAPVGTGRAMLHLLDGRSRVAVVTAPLADAIEAGRAAAWEEGRSLPSTPSLTYTPLPAVDESGRMLAFVTRGAPSLQLAKLIEHLGKEPSGKHAALVR